MSRSANKTKPLTIRPTEQHIAYFDQLIKLGIYGDSWAEVILTLANDQIKQLLKDGELKHPK